MNFVVQGYPAYAYTGGRPFEPAHPAIVFVHGAAFDHSVWQWQSRFFAHHGFCVVAPDLPGHGRSPGPVRETVGGLADWLGDLLEAAMLPSATVIGHSMGALVALELAIRRTQRVSRLALLGAALPMAVGEPFLAAAADDSPAALDMEVVWGHSRNAALASSPIPGLSLLGASRALNSRAARGVLHADLRACHQYGAPSESLRALRMPTLVVAGRRDQMAPMKAGRALADEIPGAQFEALDAGHSMMTEAPRELLALLRRFASAS